MYIVRKHTNNSIIREHGIKLTFLSFYKYHGFMLIVDKMVPLHTGDIGVYLHTVWV